MSYDLTLFRPEKGEDPLITLEARTASITLPYWHGAEAKARSAIDDLWRYLESFDRVAGYVAFDAQLDRTLDLAQDRPNVLAAYREGAGLIQRVSPAPPRPWWKFWGRS